ncbi:hypothetical protein [Azospirillum sp. B510]|nr:hypothetical protein [Azospirillum sp. B510]
MFPVQTLVFAPLFPAALPEFEIEDGAPPILEATVIDVFPEFLREAN